MTPDHKAAIERILIAADGSPSGHEAIEFGLELAQKHGAKVTFFHAMSPVVLSSWSADAEQGAVRPFPFHLDQAITTFVTVSGHDRGTAFSRVAAFRNGFFNGERACTKVTT